MDLFGEPFEGDEYKVDAEWEVKFSNGVYATVYNWKNGKNYNGESGQDVENITNWHVGGMTRKSLASINKALLIYRLKKVKTEIGA